LSGEVHAKLGRIAPRERGIVFFRHFEPTGRANARPMTGSAKSISVENERFDGDFQPWGLTAPAPRGCFFEPLIRAGVFF
jgi:hypothetical protein